MVNPESVNQNPEWHDLNFFNEPSPSAINHKKNLRRYRGDVPSEPLS